MKWVIEGADSRTGKEISTIVVAKDEEEALYMAKKTGVFVHCVYPEAMTAQDESVGQAACENCGTRFGKLEIPIRFNNHFVCAPCYQRLAPTQQIPPLQSPTATLPQRQYLPRVPSGMVPCEACQQAIAKGTTKCPHCGKSRGFDIGRFLVLLVFVVFVLWVLNYIITVGKLW